MGFGVWGLGPLGFYSRVWGLEFRAFGVFGVGFRAFRVLGV